jgi:uncharacterized damage-inducible protein DinB
MHLDYSEWASGRLLRAAAALSTGELERNFGTADGGVLGTLVHVFAADRAWLARVQGQPYADPQGQERELPFLSVAWPALHARWKEWAAALADDAVTQMLAYKDLKGNPWETPLWQIVLHVVNHATHHRGQVAGFLRSLGHVPPPLDLIAYYRSLR